MTTLPRNGSPYLLLLLVAALAILPGATLAADAVRGVTDTEIIIGTMTDLSGVTAVQAVNNVNAVRMAFDEANANGGVHGRKIRYIVEDMQYQVPKAVQAMNKLLNRDNIFFALVNGGTPMNDAVMPMMFEKNVPNVFPLTAARSMYEPFNRFKFGQFASYYDEMRSGVKYFVEQKGRKAICAMYQDSDFGRDVFAGAEAEAQALGLQIVARTAHAPTDTDFTAAVTKLREANCDMVVLGTIVRDTIIILQTAHKQGWNPDFVGQVATYSTAIAEAPGNPAEGFYAMTPALYAYPDDPRPAVSAFAAKYKARYGFDVNFLGETGYTAAQFVLAVLEKAGHNLTLDSLINAFESMGDYHDIFGSPPLTITPANHHAANQSFLTVVHHGPWVPVEPEPLGY
jgi:branched-chain amino acid transport system substrate-binding protein